MMLSVMPLKTTNSFSLNKINKSVEITTKNYSFISSNIISDLRHVEFMLAQNGDMSVLPSLHMQLTKKELKGHFDAKIKVQT